MQVVIGVFDTQEQAEQAFVRLQEAGYADDQLALIANQPAGQVGTVAEAGRTVAPAASVATADAAAAGPVAPDRTSAEAPTLAGAAPVAPAARTPGSLDKEDTFRPADDTGEIRVASTSAAADNAIENAALGTAVGMIAGGGLMGGGGVIIGAVLGGLAAGGMSAMWSRFRMGEAESRHYEDQLAAGRYLVAVEVTEDAARARELLDDAGAARVTAQAA